MSAVKTSRKQESYQEEPHDCAMPGCVEPAYHKAPKAPNLLKQYHWFCLPHVREYNAKWDYFTGMNADQIEAFRKDAVLGHRPTWRIGTQSFTDPVVQLQEAIASMLGGRPAQKQPANGTHYIRLTRKDTRALATLDLDNLPESLEELKKHYKSLVKRCHPDVNKGDKASEERFKAVTAAYQHLCGIFK